MTSQFLPEGTHRQSESLPKPQTLRRTMSVTNFSLRNPLVVSAVAVVLCIFGLFAYFSLGVAIAPKVNYPAVVVTTIYAGADPETVEANVSRPIEEAIAALPNIDTN